MTKKIIITIALLIFMALILAASLRGLPGNPTSEDLIQPKWSEQGPLELSPDRGRYALLYSLVEDRSWQFSLPIARFATPDLAISDNGQYVSLFSAGLSLLVVPGYIIGKSFGAAQVGTFAMIALFALANVMLLRAIAIRLGARPLAASIASLAFLFASPAFAYAVTLYQHHASLFLILLSLYSVLRWRSLWSIAFVWFLWALGVLVDNPNFFLMLPIGIAALGQLIYVTKDKTRLLLTIRFAGIFTLLAAVLPIMLFLWINQVSYDNPLQLAGTLPRVQAIDEAGLPFTPEDAAVQAVHEADQEKTAVGFFRTRNMLNGIYTHTISPDRGVLWYTPVLLLGILGFALIKSGPQARAGALIIAIIGVNVVLYSLWGDPWGGWAFGSRYLIPSYAMLAIGLALALSAWRRYSALWLIFIVLFGYSTGVNTLGALTSSANPPQAEVLALEELTGIEQKYTFERNWDYLKNNTSKSFVWQTSARHYLSAPGYHAVLTSLITLVAGGLTVGLALTQSRSKKENV